MTDLMPIKESKTKTTTVNVCSSSANARMIANFRNHHLVIDAPDYAEGPGEAAMPPELFLSAIGGCAIAMFELLAARDGLPLRHCSVTLNSAFGSQTRNAMGVTTFKEISLKFLLEGVFERQGQALLDTFQAGCPLYGSISMSCDKVAVQLQTQAQSL